MLLEDMICFKFEEGNCVELLSEFGLIIFLFFVVKKGELFSGLLFMVYGDKFSFFMGGDMYGLGMFMSKGIDVEVVKVNEMII